VTIRALRDAGVPLAEVTTESRRALDVLASHRAQVREQREREDAAYAAADAALRALNAPVLVEERHCPAQQFVGRIMSVPGSTSESLTGESVNEALTTLFEQLQAAGVKRSGPFWTTLTTNSNDQIAVMYCWSVAQPVPGRFGDQDTLIGELPERLELVATWHATPEFTLPEGTTHPAVVALFDALTEQNVDLKRSEVRQSIVGTDANNYDVEVAITIRES
jgi:hypothetical protein